MISFVIDSWAWVEYLRGSERGRRVEQEIQSRKTLMTSSVTLAEVISKFRREGLEIEGAYQALTTSSKVVNLAEADARDAGLLHADIKKERKNFSLGDAIVLQVARKMNARVLTGDSDFEGFDDVEMIR